MLVSLLFATALICLAGCKTEEVDYRETAPKAVKQTDFNKETYVWENFLFPTNRTSGIK